MTGYLVAVLRLSTTAEEVYDQRRSAQPHRIEEVAMSLPDNGSTGKNGVKTLAFRFKPELHAQISLVAGLRGHTLQDEVMTAIEVHIQAAKTDSELLQKIEQAQAQIERDAHERRATITALFEAPAPEPEKAAPTGKPTKATPRGNAAQQ